MPHQVACASSASHSAVPHLLQVLLDGRVTNGTALNATGATGSAANGNLGPGAILVNGTTNSGTGGDH